MPDAHTLLATLRRHVDDAHTRLLTDALGELTAVDTRLDPLADELTAYMHGGKRLRPILLLLGYLSALNDTADPTPAIGPALATELLHTCALMHDDIIDQSATRRGRPSVHTGFAQRHRENGFAGDSDVYGTAVAILLGDLAFTYADRAFFTSTAEAKPLLAAFQAFTRLREEVMAGQFLDVEAAAQENTDLDTALNIAALKSGRYSVARPLEIGATLAGASAEHIAGLFTFGEPLGRAFQLKDDLLGVFGDVATTGKSANSDLIENKRTVLIAETLAASDAATRAYVETHLGPPAADPDVAQRLRDIIVDSGAKDAVTRRIADETRASAKALATLSMEPLYRQAFVTVSTLLTERNK